MKMKNGNSSPFRHWLTCTLVLLGCLHAHAEDPAVESADEKDPRALKVLQEMGLYLRSLKHLHLSADSDTDQVLENGQTVQFSYHTELIAVSPNKLKVSVVDGPYRKTLFYNGKSFVLFDQGQHYYATGAAPATIDRLLDDMSARYGVVLPLADLFRWDTHTAQDIGINSALYINDQEINGRLCAHYAYRQPGADWQLWVHLGVKPVPCQLVIVRRDTDGAPRHSVRFRWIDDKPAPASAFEFVAPPGAQAVPLREISPPAAEPRS